MSENDSLDGEAVGAVGDIGTDRDMAMLPVAVIMSVYKNDRYERLAVALDSLIDQVGIAPGMVRIYLGIDGPVSSDIKRVIDERMSHIYKLLAFDKNRGLHFILNDLILVLEKEQFIFRMDSDDFSYPERIVRQLAYLRDHEDIDVIGTGIREVHDDGRFYHVPANRAVGAENFYQRMPVAHPTVCYRRHVIDTVGGYPEVPFNEDIAMWIECYKRGYKFGNVDECLLDFTIDGSFWKRRSYRKAFIEFSTHTRGIWTLEGVTWKYIVPLMRMTFKLMPESVKRWGYTSSAFRNVSADGR